MPEHERRHERGRIDAIDVEIARRVARMPVVVAPDQKDLEGAGQAAPAPELGQRMGGDSARLGMEEVTQHHHAPGLGA